MTPFVLGLIAIAALFALLFIRQPVWIALTLAGVLGNIFLNNLTVAKLVSGTAIFDTASSYNLSVIPLFVLMGEIASGSRMSAELFGAARVLLSGMRGGLAIASIAASGAFGAICGSSVATAASMTRIAMPEMQRAGYGRGYAAASVAAGGSVGILIPPSIILVIYGGVAELSVARLFAASMLPGLLLLVLYMIIASWRARQDGEAPAPVRTTLGEKLRALSEPWQFILLFVMTIGGIYAGIFSPNEAASIGAFGAILLGFLKRTLTLPVLFHALQSAVLVSCALFMIIVGATIFSNFIVQTRLPDTLLSLSEAAGLSAWIIMALIIAIYIVMGCFLEGIGMILITVPVFLPIVTGFGFDPIWFG
ncbi:MAG: TRAP transporter large permease subunit, partial [Hyphomicrobiales bacterium]|nr:TRAP transporter large permease subunit [Hyphomicrobiales bacterium]